MIVDPCRAALTLALLASTAGCGARTSLDDDACSRRASCGGAADGGGTGDGSSADEGSTGAPCGPSAEVCNGVDDDCDGAIDEDIAAVRCGEDGCEVTVRCEDGFMPACVPRTPTPESCNLEDDDCDGTVDEGLGFGPLGETIVLRTDEHDTGPCTSCSWAWTAALAPAGDGLLALWHLGLSGGAEQANVYGRPLDLRGRPTGEIALSRDDFLLELRPMLALDPWPALGMPLEADYRVGSDDVPGLMFVDASGGTEAVMSTPGSGPSGVPRMVWTGERFVTAWVEDDRLQVAVLAADGALEREVDVDGLERPAAITLGAFPGRVGILVSRYRDEPERRDQWFLQLDAFGEVVSPAREIPVEFTTWQRLVGTEEGWLHVRPNGFDELSTRQALDVDGDPLDEATPFADQRRLADSGLQDTFIPRPGRNEMMVAWQGPEGGDMTVQFLDGRGEVLRGWSGPAGPGLREGDDFFVSPHFAFVGDRVLLMWHGIAGNSEPNTVSVRELGCVP